MLRHRKAQYSRIAAVVIGIAISTCAVVMLS